MSSIATVRPQPTPVQRSARERPTIGHAIDRLADAAQGIVADQIAGARLDLQLVGARLLRSAALVLAGTLFLVASWTALTLAAYVLLASSSSFASDQRLGLIALAHGLLGVGLLLAAARVGKVRSND